MSDSLIKAMEIVKYIANHQGNVRQMDIVNDLKIKKATVHRYLETLTALNMVQKKDFSYYLGLEFFRLGQQVHFQKLIVEHIKPFLTEMVAMINETVNLAQYNQGKATYLFRVESNRNLQLKAQLGAQLPLHCTALGKAILSQLETWELDGIFSKNSLTQYTPATITDMDILRKQILQIKEQGYAVESEEFEEGLVCAALPLTLNSYNFIGGLSISATKSRTSSKKLLAVLKTAAPIVNRLKNALEGLKGEYHEY